MIAIEDLRWHEASPLLDELLEMERADQALRLQEIRSRDPALADTVLALLQRNDAMSMGHFLEGSALSSLGVDSSTWAGQTIGNYVIEQPIGEGGMGTVWLARRNDGRYQGRAAVKFLNAVLLGRRGGAERFKREGSALAKLAHPNIPPLFDAGVANGVPYLVMEYIEGQPIDQYCDAHRCDVAARLRLFMQVAAAVSHAHGRLILHCDLKPSNILVTSKGEVKLLDFGIARLLDDAEQLVAMTEITALSGLAFSPDFAAPEQVLKSEMTTATDVYGLGVLLYVLLTGSHPTSTGSSVQFDRLRELIEREPQRASAAVRTRPEAAATRASSPAQLVKQLRGDLDKILAKALNKTPGERYLTVDAFSADVVRHLHHEPVQVRAASLRYRAGRLARRYWVGLTAASVTILALSAAVVMTSSQAIEARRQRDEALFQSELAAASTNVMAQALQASSKSGQPLTQRDILDRSARLVDTLYGKNPKIAVHLLPDIAEQYSAQGDAGTHLKLIRKAAALAEASGDVRLIGLASCAAVTAELAYGSLAQARLQLDQGLAAMQGVDRPDVNDVFDCKMAEADLLLEEGRPELAIAKMRAVVKWLEGLDKLEDGLLGGALSFLSGMLESQGELEESYAVLQQHLQHYEKVGRDGTTDYFASRRMEARILIAWGEYVQAQKIIDDIAPRLRDAGGLNTPPVWLLITQGVLQRRAGDLVGAEQSLRPAAERARAQGSFYLAKPAEVALVQVLIDQRRPEEAASLLASIQDVRDHRADRPAVLANLRAQLLFEKGDVADALHLLQAQLNPASRLPVKPTAALCTTHQLYTRFQLALPNPSAAMRSATEAVAFCRRVARNPPHSAEVGEALLLLARARIGSGAPPEQVAAIARQAQQALRHGLGDQHRATREAAVLAER
jgi:eukaryotic-like serine/threonine-protein kinase